MITADEANSLPAVGEFFVLALDEDHPVAVSTLGSPELAEELFKLKPEGLCITGKTETENIGIEKIIQNVLATPSIQYLILCGRESEGHYSGNTILSLFENGVDNKQKVLGSKGKKPTLANISETQIAAFRTQVEIVDLIGCSDLDGILEKIKELKDKEFRKDKIRSASAAGTSRTRPVRTEIVLALEKDPEAVKLDPAGYFVIVPKPEQKQILVEHYSNKNQLLRIIKGENARNIYWMILENQWATEMSHAAYLGKELTRAEIAMEEGSKYIQDKA